MTLISSLLSRFFAWWYAELVACLPGGLRGLLRRRRSILAIGLAEEEVSLRLRTADRWRELGAIPLQPTNPSEMRRAFSAAVRGVRLRTAEVVIEVPAHHVLRRVVDLPLAALENLREVLSFEMDRHTPFKAEEVAFDYRIIGSDAVAKRIAVTIAVVPRRVVERAYGLAESFGVKPRRIGIGDDDTDARRPMDLLPPAENSEHGTLSRRLSVALALSACVLGISAAYLPLHFKRQALAAYQARLEEIRTTVIEADAFKERVASALEHTQFLVDRRLSMPTAAALLNEVTERLPDDTWLIQWRLHGEQLALSGFSPKASSLIAELEDSELLSEVRFASPVTVDPRVERERFNLSAVVTGKPRK